MIGRARRGIRAVVRAVAPPVLTDLYRRARPRRSEAPSWTRVTAWPETYSIPGWTAGSVLDANVAPWWGLRGSDQNSTPLGTTPESSLAHADQGLHNRVMSLAYVLARARADGRPTSVLDWMGGVGGNYVFARSLFGDLELDYHCADIQLLANAGKVLLPEMAFHAIGDVPAGPFDLVLGNDSIHTTQDWKSTLSRLAAASSGYLYVARLPVLDEGSSYVAVHRPDPTVYDSVYPGWFLARQEFLEAARSDGFSLEREFLVGEGPDVPGAARASVRGFLFAKRVRAPLS